MAKDHNWQQGTVFDNVAAVVSVIGVESPGVVWGLANVGWESVEERDRFLSLLRKKGNT